MLMDASTRNELLASNLLFATLALTVLFTAAGWVAAAVVPLQTYFHPMHFNVLTAGAAGIFLLIRGGLYYGVRLGAPAAKWLATIGFIVFLYLNTRWHAGMIGGVYFAPFTLGALLILANDLLTLAALVIMYKKPRVATA